MPVDYSNYPANWMSEIRPAILSRAGLRCECLGADCDHEGRCGEVHGAESIRFAGQLGLGALQPSRPGVVLTIAHLDHDPMNSDPTNLSALCQWCHLRYDRNQHAATRRATLLQKMIETHPDQLDLLSPPRKTSP